VTSVNWVNANPIRLRYFKDHYTVPEFYTAGKFYSAEEFGLRYKERRRWDEMEEELQKKWELQARLHMLRSLRLDAGPGAKRLHRAQVFRSLSRRLDGTRLLSLQAACRCIRLADQQTKRVTIEDSRRYLKCRSRARSIVRIVRYRLYAVIQRSFSARAVCNPSRCPRAPRRLSDRPVASNRQGTACRLQSRSVGDAG